MMTTNEPILSTRSLEKRFGGVKAVAGVDFTLQHGELRCLIGPNGAGKSTFFKLVTGQLRPSSGEIRILGRDAQRSEAHEIAAWGVGIKNQVPDVMNGLTARENIWLAAASQLGKADIESAVDKVAERLSLTPIMGRLVGELAHGQRQWVEIAMVIVCGPKIILLDEPAAGMSDEETQLTARLIHELNRSMTVVVVEHDMDFIRQIAKTVTVFHQGRILMEDSFDKIIADETIRDVYLGRSAGV